MAITIPESEPLEFYSGTTVKWKRTDLTDYPAPTQKDGLKKPDSVIEATNEYKADVDPTSLWIETRYTGNQQDTVPTGLLFDDFRKFARENDIQLEPTFDSRRFGNTVMKKYKSKPKRIEGELAKHYFGFRLPN